jgi:acetyl/propionyl-CoA carboxylase alpha subunit
VFVFVNTTGVCGNKVHVPIRDSKLTHLLRDDLMGGAEMCLIASLCGLKEQAEETYSTLNFALRAMRVQTTSPILTTLVTRAAAAEFVPAETPEEMIQQMATVNQKLYQENQELKAALWERDRASDSEREERESEERQRGRDIQERQREGESFNRNGNSSTRQLPDGQQSVASRVARGRHTRISAIRLQGRAWKYERTGRLQKGGRRQRWRTRRRRQKRKRWRWPLVFKGGGNMGLARTEQRREGL